MKLDEVIPQRRRIRLDIISRMLAEIEVLKNYADPIDMTPIHRAEIQLRCVRMRGVEG
jgi:hypothetical protein